MLVPFELDTSVITSTIGELSTAAGPIITAGLGVAVLFFGVPFLWRKAKALMS